LAGLSLLIITIYLFRKKGNTLVTLLPMSFVLGVTLWAMVENLIEFISGSSPNYLLAGVGGLLLVLALWVLLEGILVYKKEKVSLSK
jgi:carbon starvation protein